MAGGERVEIAAATAFYLSDVADHIDLALGIME
jgi:hypothetical protein